MADASVQPGDFYVAELPSAGSAVALNDRLASPPVWNEAERHLDAALRRTCVVRLGSYFKPGARHLKFAEEFLLLVREGYAGRGRVAADHQRRIRDFAARHEAGTLLSDEEAGAEDAAADGSEAARRVTMTRKAIGIRNTAKSAVLLGMPGMGKSLTTEEVLNSLPEVIEHRTPILKQVVWMKLDCPQKGSVRALCVDFFAEMDRIFETDHYSRTYAPSRATEETMMSHMAVVANLHALGVLVIDEIQHLGNVGEENDLFLKFIVTLINKIGVPVLLIGTSAATKIVRRTMRLGRRSVGVGSAIWERYSAEDGDWTAFVDDLWTYQWTNVDTPLDENLRHALYDGSQGIVDLAVKLYMLAQLRAIRRGVALGKPERITPSLLRAVATEELAVVRPLIDALRRGDRHRIEKFGDLSSLRDHFTSILRAETGDAGLQLPASGPGQRGTRGAEEAPGEMSDADRFFQQVYRQAGIGDDVGRRVLEELRSEHGQVEDVFKLLDLFRERLGRKPAGPKRASARRKPQPQAPDDLRSVVAAGAAEGLSGYRALMAAGLAGPGALLRSA